ncbi:unnamed protein product [Clonostachys rhizophaga]|uniref:Uncharacterized protein n=1 Tax=Clonostachys rhizophaga TaxID=160324 RepID=A0A9N9VCN4_9HYPO|nr:unnamed protein product [Clonostachys rhizophaga]
MQASYHDHQAKAMLTKIAKQMAAEAALPEWLPPILQDLLIWEAIKTKFGLSFNRFACILLEQDANHFRDYYSQHTIAVGHCLPLLAKTLLRMTEGGASDLVNNLEDGKSPRGGFRDLRRGGSLLVHPKQIRLIEAIFQSKPQKGLDQQQKVNHGQGSPTRLRS